MKYVMFEFTPPGSGVQHHYALLFPENIVHSMVAEAHIHYKHGTEKRWVRPKAVSAGFYCMDEGVCHGKSESLNMEPHPDDAKIINLEHNGTALFPR